MVDSTSCAALDLVWDTLDATIVLGQDIPSLPCRRSRRPTRPIPRPASTHPVESTISRRRPAGAAAACSGPPAACPRCASWLRPGWGLGGHAGSVRALPI